MQVAKIIGRATSTVKHPSLQGWKLLIAQPLGVNDKPDGAPQLIIDGLGAAQGDRVVITSDGKTVRETVKAEDSPIRYMSLGLVDP
ncbi:Ethanolamine utilization protein EutN [Planctopirus ephydatiae]|uniref:Ethanolamine utilization protein EutN n=1 Tax=Planctopirus ephydatiae TaxID=2528019 RepID=A0A518GPZ2_9PLAN|nr:EutN/CcmL family microcompartment protein [Planctopirus ephydatiae]QDV30666.1 Ethanolamine utilization protein EutN [Planctopirus ephydatiae]